MPLSLSVRGSLKLHVFRKSPGPLYIWFLPCPPHPIPLRSIWQLEEARAQVSWLGMRPSRYITTGPFHVKSSSLTKSRWPQEQPFNLHYLVYIGNIYMETWLKLTSGENRIQCVLETSPPSPVHVRRRLFHFFPNWPTGLHFACTQLALNVYAASTRVCASSPRGRLEDLQG